MISRVMLDRAALVVVFVFVAIVLVIIARQIQLHFARRSARPIKKAKGTIIWKDVVYSPYPVAAAEGADNDYLCCGLPEIQIPDFMVGIEMLGTKVKQVVTREFFTSLPDTAVPIEVDYCEGDDDGIIIKNIERA